MNDSALNANSSLITTELQHSAPGKARSGDMAGTEETTARVQLGKVLIPREFQTMTSRSMENKFLYIKK